MFKKAKIHLTLNHGFFAEVPLKMKFVEDVSVGTVGINSTEIRYNPEFVQRLSKNERIAVLAHEALHYLHLHHIHGKGKDQDDWNIACDYAINEILIKEKFQLPADRLYDPKYKNMNAERIYDCIRRDKNQEQNKNDLSGSDGSESKDKTNGSDGNEKGNGKPKPQDWGKVLEPTDDVNIAEAEAEAKQMALSAMNTAKAAGNLPGGIEEIINELLEPKQNWKELTLKAIAEKAKNDYNWTTPNRRYIQQGIYLPSLESIELGKVVFVMDTSSSVDRKLLAEFITEIREASSLFNFPLVAIHCDTKVQKVEEVDEDSVITPVGRGGTSFTPAFDYVNDNLPETKMLIYFTDGFCRDKVEEPEYETLWMIYGNPTFKYHFGNVIHIE